MARYLIPAYVIVEAPDICDAEFIASGCCVAHNNSQGDMHIFLDEELPSVELDSDGYQIRSIKGIVEGVPE